MLLATRAQIRRALDRYGRDPATFSLIHADLHHANLLVNDRDLSIIDFDDAGFGWHQYDIAVALSTRPRPGTRPSLAKRSSTDTDRPGRCRRPIGPSCPCSSWCGNGCHRLEDASTRGAVGTRIFRRGPIVGAPAVCRVRPSLLNWGWTRAGGHQPGVDPGGPMGQRAC